MNKGLPLTLYALLNGRKIQATHDLPRNEKYLCLSPFCTNPQLILKKGMKKIPHFAHMIRSTCDDYSERETQAHIAMKVCMQETLGIDEKFMEYGEIRGVKPDLLWKNQYAIEVQHSPISVKEIKRRNQIYLEHNLIPLWIFHQEEGEEYAYYDHGSYGKYHTIVADEIQEKYSNYNIIRLKEAEKYLADQTGRLFHMMFSSDKMPVEGDRGFSKLLPLRFDQKNGPWFFFRSIARISERNILYLISKEFAIRSKEDFIGCIPGFVRVRRESNGSSIQVPDFQLPGNSKYIILKKLVYNLLSSLEPKQNPKIEQMFRIRYERRPLFIGINPILRLGKIPFKDPIIAFYTEQVYLSDFHPNKRVFLYSCKPLTPTSVIIEYWSLIPGEEVSIKKYFDLRVDQHTIQEWFKEQLHMIINYKRSMARDRGLRRKEEGQKRNKTIGLNGYFRH